MKNTSVANKNPMLSRVLSIPGILVLAVIFGLVAVVMWHSLYSPSTGSLALVRGNAAMQQPTRVPVPEEVRGIYWTAFTAGSPKRLNEHIAYMQETGLNAVVIDLKMDNGAIAYNAHDPLLQEYMLSNPPIQDLEALLERLADAGIYRIARVPVMRDATNADLNSSVALKRANGTLWRDSTGAAWVDPAAPEVATYAITLAREAYQRGFDEIQFDYIRFPDEGLNSIVYPVYNEDIETKVEVMQRFFNTIGAEFHQRNIPVSFDVFGITFWTVHDYNIGQRAIDAYPNGAYLSPMVYPSHYPDGFEGFANPAEHPYQIIYRSLERGKQMFESELGVLPEDSQVKIRPWLQDFDIGAVYTSDLIEAQIQAVRDAGGSGWILWNARNVYEPAHYVTTN